MLHLKSEREPIKSATSKQTSSGIQDLFWKVLRRVLLGSLILYFELPVFQKREPKDAASCTEVDTENDKQTSQHLKALCIRKPPKRILLLDTHPTFTYEMTSRGTVFASRENYLLLACRCWAKHLSQSCRKIARFPMNQATSNPLCQCRLALSHHCFLLHTSRIPASLSHEGSKEVGGLTGRSQHPRTCP